MPMRLLLVLCFSLLGMGLTNGAALALTCEPSIQRNAKSIQGEVVGGKVFSQRVNSLWVFSLEPALYGWDIRLRDGNGMDLSQITPPFRTVPNPRQIYGWHFRNAANTDKNSGDVNAPQGLRLFQFSPSLTGTGGFRPPTGVPGPETADRDNGRGALTVLDMGLTDLEPGQKARMNYLKFQICLTWPKKQEQIIEQQNSKSPVYLDEERETMYGCGLDSKSYELSAWILPRWISGNMDGHDALDEIAAITRKSDGRKGIAICRAGTWISLIGYDHKAQIPLRTNDGEPRTEKYFSLAQYLERMEYWKMDQSDKGKDRLILGRREKAEVAIYWDGKQFSHELLWVVVEGETK